MSCSVDRRLRTAFSQAFTGFCRSLFLQPAPPYGNNAKVFSQPADKVHSDRFTAARRPSVVNIFDEKGWSTMDFRCKTTRLDFFAVLVALTVVPAL